MSIHGFLNKINRAGRGSNFLPLYILIITASSLFSFFLGRLSIPIDTSSSQVLDTKEEIINKNQTSDAIKVIDKETTTASNNNQQREGKYVASKNGKLYYSSGCKGASRIKPENRVWFDTESDAQKSGYTWATSCE